MPGAPPLDPPLATKDQFHVLLASVHRETFYQKDNFSHAKQKKSAIQLKVQLGSTTLWAKI